MIVRMRSSESIDPAHTVTPGRNCWRIERADRARLIIDADDYFRAARAAMKAAERRIMLIGWDFDSRIDLGTSDDPAEPARIGPLLPWLVRRRPDLDIYLLRWNFGAIKSLFRGMTAFSVARWWLNKRIHVKFDSAHPLGASHHQKIVVIDDCLAFCGGIDMTAGRWDTRDHLDDNPERTFPSGKAAGPWHDATVALEGPIARALAELARDRWHSAGGAELTPIDHRNHCWPDDLEPHFRDVDVAIARTHPEYGDHDVSHEIEQLYIDLIRRAKRFIYAESQYFASRKIAEAIVERLKQPDPPEIVLINPAQADGWLEQEAMDTARARLWDAIREVDTDQRFRMYHAVTQKRNPIYVHAKIMIVDDTVLRVGSSNWNNRSLRLDTECDIAIDADLPANADARAVIAERLADLLGEHLGRTPDEVARELNERGSLIDTIEHLRSDGRSLRPYRRPSLSKIERVIADNELLDPEGPDAVFEPIAKRGLFRRLRHPR